MDEQKWSSSSWLLLQEFVRLRQEQEKELRRTDDDARGVETLPLPVIPYHRARTLMTRTDFLEGQ